MSEKKISVIVPIYNAEDTITACLGNLLNQTFPDMEIILIDDASTDGTSQILQDAKNQFPEKVRVFRQETNHGPGAARNIGLDVATGEYIGFVDADDVIDVSMYEKLYATAMIMDGGADITDCAFYRKSHDKALLHFDENMIGVLDAKKKSDLIASGGFVWSKLFKKSLLNDNGIRFRASYGLEDMDFLIASIAIAKNASSTDDVLYVYNDTASSLSKEIDFGKYYQNHIGALIGIYERTNGLPDYNGIKDACEYGMSALYSNILKLAYKKRNDIPRDIMVELLEGLRQVRFSCITGRITKNPYYKLLDNDARTVIKLADDSVDALLSAV